METGAATSTMPAVFFGHGSPMNAIETNEYTEAWRELGASIPRPRAILSVSAHWFINATAVTAMAVPPTIHDFYGFPEELFAVDYPAPGDPALAEEVADVVHPTWVGQDRDSWGIDHGTWSVLVHAFPGADIPVVQLAINAQKPYEYHLDLGARLAPLREQGVLVVGTGNVVHNLRQLDWSRPTHGAEWNRRFDDAARDLLATSPDEVVRLSEHADHDLAVPTPDHFVPLLYVAGLAAAAGVGADAFVEGSAFGSLSMAGYTVGGPCPEDPTTAGASAGGPSVDGVEPEDTNL